ncbi:hypothetical protein ACN47E_001724 [Coniothyrium glycines]
MSSPMTANGYDTPDLSKDDLTNEVIYTLYDIACRAEASSDKSSRALFAAYAVVLEEQGLQPSDDAVLHRFLFHMQKDRRRDEEPVQRLRRVLKESFGIDIEIDEDGEGIEVTTNLEAMRDGAQASLGRYSRRGSFDSFFDGTADKIAGVEHGDLPIRKRRGSQGGVPYRSSDTWAQRRTRSDTEVHPYQHAQLPVRGGLNGAHRTSTWEQRPPHRKRSASVSNRGSLQIRRIGPAAIAHDVDDDGGSSDFTERTTSLDLSHVQIPGLNAPIPYSRNERAQERNPFVPEPYRPSDTRLLDEAATFEEQRLHRVTRQCIQRWRNHTQKQIVQREHMEQLALAFDRRILIRLSFEQLQGTARLRRSNRETNRFFQRLEARADKARNLFLITKAFTHWAKSAEDEVQRTSVARRHILRTRFFNGWRDITAVNELKIQHFVLGKFLRTWRARTAIVRENSLHAVSLYEDNLVRRVYKDWFFHWCAIAAPAWRNDRIRRVTLQKWSEITKVLRERQVWAVDRRDRMVAQHQWQHWQKRSVAIQLQHHKAEQFRHDSILSSALLNLRKDANLRPLLRQYQERHKRRLLGNTFMIWQKNAVQFRQARDMDCMRVLRNAYIAWNDRLRIKAVEDRINDRIIVESLYRWTLASRVSLFQRVHNRQLKQSAFLTWVTKTNQRTNTLDAAERRFAQFKRTHLLQSCLRKMEAITAEKRAEEYAIAAGYEQKLKQRIFERLKEKEQHFQQLNQWSDDACFYILSKRTLKTWSEATQLARRNRRRAAYSQFRRAVKVSLVRRMFGRWQDRANQIAMQNSQATISHKDRLRQTGSVLLHQWHDRTVTLIQQNTQAENFYNYRMGTKHLHTWMIRTEQLQSLEDQALALRRESIEIAATSVLKKLGWRLWNVQRQEENARALRERNFEKHVRAIIRFWSEQATERLANRPASPTPTSRSRGGRRDHEGDERRDAGHDKSQVEEGDDETQRLEAWTAFDESALNLDNDLDLSLSTTPDQRRGPYPVPPPTSSPPPRPSSLARPNTYPQPQSILRRPPQTIPEDGASELDFGGQSTFWSGTPAVPPPVSSMKPGYLKTPSKRSVVRAKRPELPASPERRVLSPVRRGVGAAGTMSAPPVQANRNAVVGGVTSFERRLREGGFGRSVAGTSGYPAIGRARGIGTKGKGRVEFGDVSQMG